MTAAGGGHRLLAINNYYYRRGGAESIFLDHIKMFEAIGWEVAPFAMQHPYNLPSQWSEHFVAEIEYGRDSNALTKFKQAAKIIYSREARRNVTALIERARPTIAHAHNVYHHLSPSVFSALKQAGVPTVMTAHDLKLACPAYKMLTHGSICEKCRGGRIHNVVVNRCVKDSLTLSGLILVETLTHRGLGLYRDTLDRIVMPSRFYLTKLIEWGWRPEQLVYVPNFVEATDVPSDWEEDDYFVYAGRLAPEKGLATLIRAAALSDLKVVIAGSGPEEGALKRLAFDLGADVTFAGYVDGPALQRLIGQAKALVLPSEWYENAPVSVLEAYALGTPVIGASIGGIPELIREDETGFSAVSGDVEDLARTMTRMAALPARARASMGAAGRDWTLREFSSDLYRDRMLDVYRSVGAFG